jgi:ferric-dicitrate binding protein FerR (iron transport regulator)
VWVQPGSSIHYNDDFSTDRYLELEGEAFFDITKNPELPFRVQTKDLLVEVLGTEFNVKTDSGKPTSVTLATGSVKVLTPDHKEIKLVPNQRLVFDELTSQAVVEEVEMAEMNATRELIASLNFVDEPIEEALRDIAAFYALDLSIQQWRPTNDLVNLDMDNQMLPYQVLDILQSMTDSFEYELTSKQLIIKNPR